MRIQHNIMAMNAYRNYNNNTSALSKNLEKLSSGYKINRAGDDAAGLAISEKMRAQITGLKAASKNVKDGVSLVKTAEGAMQEIHDMLNRMDSLATQSANGTYDNEVDRANLQKEVTALKSEIDRIADSSNFNGLKLLDGSLSKTGTAASSKDVLADLSKLGIDLTANATDVNAVAGKYTTSALNGGNEIDATGGVDVKDRYNVEVKYTDKDGKEQTVSVSLFLKDKASQEIYLDDGTKEGKKLTTQLTAAGKISKVDLGKVLKEALNNNDQIKSNFTVDTTGTDDTLSFTAKTKGTDGAVLNSVTFSKFDASEKDKGPSYGVTTEASKVDVTTEATDATKSYDFEANGKIWDSKLTDDKGNQMAKLEDAIFEINGKKFAFVANDPNDDDLKALREAGVEHWVKTGNAGAIDNNDVKAMVEKIKKETGLNVEQGKNVGGAWTAGNATADDISIIIKPGKQATEGTEEGGLKLQIGDTAEDFNQLTVSVGDMHAKALGIGDLSIADQEGAAKAIQSIKDAINSVSSTRGDLGAIQNRLEHTQNNLSVMTENIQDAESSIRDTDVADEMMAYTKNNILIQSAQAMLAQANQVPQGVLQLLQ